MKEVFGKRLKNARKMKGLSQRALSSQMGGIVSDSAIDKYEKGKMMPSSSVIIKLSEILEQNIDYFFRPFSVNIDASSIKYRKKASLGKKELISIQEYVSNELEKYIEVENIANEQESFKINYSDIIIETEDDVLSIASRLRKDLELGKSGIISPIEILEGLGVKIIEVNTTDKFDGFSFTVSGIFVIVLNKRFTPERKRLSLFHELGHKILCFSDKIDDKTEERLCNIFANEVLLPSDVFISRIGRFRNSISLIELKDLQSQYGISVDAMIVKARLLNIISSNTYASFFKKKNKIPAFKETAQKSIYPEEYSVRFKRIVYKLLANEVITISKGANLLNISVNEVEKELNLI